MDSGEGSEARCVGFFTATSIVVANMVGTGVFTSLGFQAAGITSTFALLSLWFVGGVFALCGALSYGELGAAMPRSGGEYRILSEVYHPSVGFLSGWVSVTVGFSAPIAAAAMAFGAYLACVFPGLDPTLPAVAAVVAISLVHMTNLKHGSRFQNLFTSLKVLLISGFVLCGLFAGGGEAVALLPGRPDLRAVLSPAFAVSLVFVMYAYSGWNASVYLAGELRDPERTLPRSLLAGTLLVTALYMLLNYTFLATTPIQELAGQLEVGFLSAGHVFGQAGARIMGGLICLGLVSSMSSMVWAGPRVTQAMGEDMPFFGALARRNRGGVPVLAIAFQLAIVLLLLATSSFEMVITYLGFTLVLCSFVTILGVFVHRFRFPQARRPCKSWGYPVTQILFLAIGLWMIVYLLMDKPIESLAGLGTIALGFPVYLLSARWGANRQAVKAGSP